MPNMTGSELKALREQEGMTQEQLGKRLGVNRDTIRRYERQDSIPEMVELAVSASRSPHLAPSVKLPG